MSAAGWFYVPDAKRWGPRGGEESGRDEGGRLVLRPGRQAVGTSGRGGYRPSRGHNGSVPVRPGVAPGPGGVDGSPPRPGDRRAPAPTAAARTEARFARAAAAA